MKMISTGGLPFCYTRQQVNNIVERRYNEVPTPKGLAKYFRYNEISLYRGSFP